ncbi:hypothetical protein VTL71DRAFT_4460 [Oculimacula yallundae]|uniref:Uncharacterized protein n=1 Tax=Oculimacula yallundae TaxID=86028 RepID=A0ABR4C369_9HELO
MLEQLQSDARRRQRWLPPIQDGATYWTVESYLKWTYWKVAVFRRKAVRVSINGNSTYSRPDTASNQDIVTEKFAIEHGITIERGESNQSLFKLGASTPRGFIDFHAHGIKLVGCADTGSDLDFMSFECARHLGLKIDGSARSRVMLADESIVETIGQVHVSSVEISNFDSFEMSFHVLPGLASDVIFSEDFLEQMDAFNTCVQVKNTTSLFQQRLNTLISLGPLQNFLSKAWGRNRVNPTQEEDCKARDAETCRRSNVKRSIRKMSDRNRADLARASEELIKRGFDRDHASCAHCNREGLGG